MRPSPRSLPTTVPVNVYIDGYNFYRPIEQLAEETRSPEVLKLAWCNYCALGDRLARRAFGVSQVSSVKLFTPFAREEVRGMLDPRGLMRKNLWLEALRLGTDSRLHISSGRWEKQGRSGGRGKEKLTDVKLSISLVRDAFSPPRLAPIAAPHPADVARMFADDDPAAPFEHAIVISSDKDFLPAAELAARERSKNVAIFFPYQSAGYQKPIGSRVFFGAVQEEDLRQTHLPDEIAHPEQAMPVRWADYVASKGWAIREEPDYPHAEVAVAR
jgi:hypothetical protein